MNISHSKIPRFTLLLLCTLAAKPAFSDATAQRKASFEPLSTLECAKLESVGIYTADNPVPCSRLSKVKFSYVTDDGVINNDGEIVVFDSIAPKVASLTDALLTRKFYIAKARPVEAYGGDDHASMADNNTSAFNGRNITGSSIWSLHAFGAAIDLNPLQNPFIEISEDGQAQISPSGSAHYSVNRSEERPGKPKRSGMAENVVDLFAMHGFFVWGGDWNYPIDYQHFQIGPRSFVEALASKNIADGQRLIDHYIFMYTTCRSKEKSGDGFNASRKECVAEVLDDMP